MNKVVDKVAGVTAGVAFGAYKNKKKGETADRRRAAIVGGRGIPDSILSTSNEKNPAFRAKVNAMNAKSEILEEVAQEKRKLLRSKLK